ncbi:GNAT family N-acetyltransferase [Streptomyces sp. ISL-22]|uniref:GNAT family N-acetyltransferase n=1 Tax=unclassified Streptomyces TaxID=2593676 RepID=UPI001BE77537|nr:MULTISPECIES: GNAT family N-acetyltransferase [unclassified Streptomyces]MBT2419311.1 GNAT family N-acetyltransferase [Streptomyces sp. ISL-24]MBT2436807.1 GNAT family N-acetyltransferase [Streptomyces sp. ISL-22]
MCKDPRVNDLRVRQATEADLTTLVRLRDDAARWMLAHGITGQWRPGELDEDHFSRIMARGEVWLAETDGRVTGAWELWWEDDAAWGPQPPVAGYVHRLMVDRNAAAPGTGRRLLRAAERRVAAVGRTRVRLDCLAGNARLNAYYQDAGYRVVGLKEGKPQPGGTPKSFTLLEKELGQMEGGEMEGGEMEGGEDEMLHVARRDHPHTESS